jgi:D-glycero-D-manno-heptose 1,7-bisphosphate phosphatase
VPDPGDAGAPRGLRPAVFLDRDGVLNRVSIRDGMPFGPTSPGDFVLVDGAAADVRRLKEAGYAVIVATNQPELARGGLRAESLEAMHARLRAEVPVDAIFVCPHDDGDRCGCRKPRPGLLLSAAREHGIDLPRSYMVGDRWRDVEAGKAAGCRTVFVEMGYREALRSPPDHVATGLGGAVRWILDGRADR